MTMPYTRPPQHQRGATLIEVMVSALIVAFGVLAMIALQANSIKFSKTSEYRSVATLLANDLADRMKLNPDQVVAGSYNSAASETYSASGTAPGLGSCTTTTTNVQCTPAQLAARDLGEWQRALWFGLPGGSGFVQANAADRTVDIWIAWMDPGTPADRPAGECPATFVPSDVDGPRCMFFRIGLR